MDISTTAFELFEHARKTNYYWATRAWAQYNKTTCGQGIDEGRPHLSRPWPGCEEEAESSGLGTLGRPGRGRQLGLPRGGAAGPRGAAGRCWRWSAAALGSPPAGEQTRALPSCSRARARGHGGCSARLQAGRRAGDGGAGRICQDPGRGGNPRRRRTGGRRLGWGSAGIRRDPTRRTWGRGIRASSGELHGRGGAWRRGGRRADLA